MLLFSDTLVNREATRFYDKGLDWVMSTGPKIIMAIVVLVLGLLLIRILRSEFKKSLHKKKVHSSIRPFIVSLVSTALNVALVFLVMEIVGIKLTIFAAVIAAFGAAAGLALSGTLQNFASGVLILLLKPFKVGDNIVTQGFEGTVGTIQIFFTIITTYDNKTVIMPNSKLSNEVIVNVTLKGDRRLDFELNMPHSSDYEKAKQVLLTAFKAIPEICDDPPPRVGISKIDKDGYTIMNSVWVKAHGFEDSRQKINEQLITALHKAGIYAAS